MLTLIHLKPANSSLELVFMLHHRAVQYTWSKALLALLHIQISIIFQCIVTENGQWALLDFKRCDNIRRSNPDNER